MIADLLFLRQLRTSNSLGIRLGTEMFAVWGVWDNVSPPSEMAKFAAFLRSFGSWEPELMAPLSA